MQSIDPSELVMRARQLVFHLNCFSCAQCDILLTKGDQYCIRDSSVLCRLHYGPTTPTSLLPPSANILPVKSTPYQYSEYNLSPKGQTSPNDTIPMKIGPGGGYFLPSPHNLGDLSQTPRQKGRPRKRKPKDIESMTASMGKCFLFY